MASVVFTRGHLGTTHAADRLRARESTAECMQGRTRVVMGRPRARIRAHARTAKGARRASAVCVVFCSSLAPVWRARANTKTRDYRTFESAHRAQTACAPAHQRARKQAPQSVAQWLLPFSHTVPPPHPTPLSHYSLLSLRRESSHEQDLLPFSYSRLSIHFSIPAIMAMAACRRVLFS